VRILLVEDDPLIREFVVEALREEDSRSSMAPPSPQPESRERRRRRPPLIGNSAPCRTT
jgi:DNA-binding response OmpR family regulator